MKTLKKVLGIIIIILLMGTIMFGFLMIDNNGKYEPLLLFGVSILFILFLFVAIGIIAGVIWLLMYLFED